MDIIVCMKQVPDTNVQIQVAPDGKDIQRTGIAYVINPYDEFAIEEAVRIKERLGGTVTIICIGPDRVSEQIRAALAMGADRAIHVNDPALESADHFQIAKVLAEIIKKQTYRLVLCGKQAVDDYAFIVGPALAEYLGLPHVTYVKKIDFAADQKSVTAEREAEGQIEVVECSLPAVLTIEKGINEPRYAALPDILKAKKKEIKVETLQSLGIDAQALGPSRVKIEKYSTPPLRQAGKVLKGEPQDAVKELVRLLHEEAQVI